ncbi:hypothetical protein F5Y04DRAFT_252322 [Hypomontagnella monticulosa]|nr:hypothetical protein F5Y04DRAFT_252322 [Hypomontagnella monticulosa]
MAPGQNTFSIIPNAPGAINGDLDKPQPRTTRPMTTKQAKKAYQKANRGPKLSKAEQRRQELFEQDRIRKEFEKEKNQARARAARDKKREKEEKERAEKKRKGLPLVEVHPSQDTIAWFVRGQKKKNQENQDNQEHRTESPVAVSKDESDSGTLSAEGDPEPPPKRQKTECQDLQHSPSSTGVLGGLTSAAPDPDPNQDPDRDTHRNTQQDLHTGEVSSKPRDPIERHPTPKQSNLDVDDLATVELLDDELLNELVDNTDSPAKDDANAARDRDMSPSRDQKIVDSTPPPQSPRPPSSIKIAKELPPAQKPEDSASPSSVQRPLQTLTMNEVNSKVNNITPIEPSLDQPKPATIAPSVATDSPALAPKKFQSSVSASRSFRHPKTPMGPPPVPPKFRPHSYSSATNPRTPPFLLKKTQSPKSRPVVDSNAKQNEGQVTRGLREEYPPTSTQLFVLRNLEDLFPSPSQEARELFEEPKPIARKSDSEPTRRTIYPTLPPPRRNPPSRSMSRISDPIHSTPPAADGKTKNRGLGQKNAPLVQARNAPPVPRANVQFSSNSEEFDMPFFSTQDLLLSSQDMKDLEYGATSTNSKSIHSHSFSHLTTTPTLACQSAASASFPTGKDSSQRTLEHKDRHNPPKAPKDEIHTTNRGHRNEPLNTLRAGNRTASPRNSPKPFFASNRDELHYEYIKERRKTTAWERGATPWKVQEELKRLQKLEAEHLKRQLPERTVNKNSQAISASGSKSDPKPKNPAPRHHIQSGGQPQTRSINQLSIPAGKGPYSNKGNEQAGERQRQAQSRSSYEKMLELLEQKDTRKQEEQIVAASQETDYGEAGLDDVFCEMLQQPGSSLTIS